MTLFRRIFVEKKRFIYPLIAVAILNAALFVAVEYPLSLKVANGERDAQAAATARAAARADFETARATVTGKASADTELKKFYGDVLPPDLSAARRAVYGRIDKLAGAADIKPAQQTFDVKQEKGSDLAKYTATVALTGDYRSIRRMIHDLETSPDFLILESVALTQGQEREQGLNVVLKIATYFRAADGH
jgi:hypothetical protein